MEQFEYSLVGWPPRDGGTETLRRLNEAGAEGWEAVGLTARTAPVPMAGMGAEAVPEVVVLLKRRMR